MLLTYHFKKYLLLPSHPITQENSSRIKVRSLEPSIEEREFVFNRWWVVVWWNKSSNLSSSEGKWQHRHISEVSISLQIERPAPCNLKTITLVILGYTTTLSLSRYQLSQSKCKFKSELFILHHNSLCYLVTPQLSVTSLSTYQLCHNPYANSNPNYSFCQYLKKQIFEIHVDPSHFYPHGRSSWCSHRSATRNRSNSRRRGWPSSLCRTPGMRGARGGWGDILNGDD